MRTKRQLAAIRRYAVDVANENARLRTEMFAMRAELDRTKVDLATWATRTLSAEAAMREGVEPVRTRLSAALASNIRLAHQLEQAITFAQPEPAEAST